MTRRHKPLDFSTQVSRTSQEDLADSNINTIVGHYMKGTPLPNRADLGYARYGDFSEAPDYMEALAIIQHAKDQFDGLPAKVRAKFNHEPEKFLEWIHQEDHLDEAAELGLLTDEAQTRIKAAKTQGGPPAPPSDKKP